jgi:aarF domain-containing kinase
MRGKVVAAAAATAAALLATAVGEFHPLERGLTIERDVLEGVQRSARASLTVGTPPRNLTAQGAIVAWDYKRHWRDDLTDGERRQVGGGCICANTREIHLRNAERLLRLFERNGGVYLKAGQYMAAMAHVLPAAYVETMRVCQDNCPTMPLPDVERVVAEETGLPLHKMLALRVEPPHPSVLKRLTPSPSAQV